MPPPLVPVILDAIMRQRGKGDATRGASIAWRALVEAGLIPGPRFATPCNSYTVSSQASREARWQSLGRWTLRTIGVRASARAIIRGCLAIGMIPRWKDENRKKLAALKAKLAKASEQSQGQ